jgi:actin-related protein
LKKYSPEVQEKLVQNIFLTGALVQIPGICQRLETDLMEMRPFKSNFRVCVASNPALDAWKGAQKFAREYADQVLLAIIILIQVPFKTDGTFFGVWEMF